MITTFANHDTEQIFRGKHSKTIPPELQKIAQRKLIMINAAVEIRDLRTPPGNHLEKLSDPRLPEYSIKINDQWRIVFDFDNEKACRVKIIDYH